MEDGMAKGYTVKMDEPCEGRILAPLGATMARFSLDDAAEDVAAHELADIKAMLDKANTQPALLEALEEARSVLACFTENEQVVDTLKMVDKALASARVSS